VIPLTTLIAVTQENIFSPPGRILGNIDRLTFKENIAKYRSFSIDNLQYALCSHNFLFCCLDFTEGMWLSTDPKMNKQGASGKRKHLIVTVPQKLGRIRRRESDESRSVILQHTILDCQLLYKETEVPICMAQRVSVKVPQKQWSLQQPK